jgi:hypothetical protein
LDLTHPYHIYQACLIPAPSRLFPKQNTWYEKHDTMTLWPAHPSNHVIIEELEILYQWVTRRHCTTHWQVFNPPELGGDFIFNNHHQFLQNSEMTEPPVLSKSLDGN